MNKSCETNLFCGSSSSEDDEDELNCSEDDSLLVSLRDLRFFLAVRLLRWLGGVESLLDERVVRTLRPRASDWLLSLRATTRRCLSPLVSGFLCRSSSSSRCRFCSAPLSPLGQTWGSQKAHNIDHASSIKPNTDTTTWAI